MRRITPVDPTAWVDAAPFAAHLAHLSNSTGLPWPVVAAHAGVPLRTAERLMAGRRRSRLRRIPRATAQQLFGVEPESLARLGLSAVAADASCRRVAALLGRGVPLLQLARQLGCSADLVARMADGSPATVSAEVALRVRVACETADRACLHRAADAA